MSEQHPSPQERKARGRALRKATPRESHADYASTSDRTDPVALIEGQNESRLQFLLPVRRARMVASPFAFFRGAARIMASDLAPTPVSGLTTQICGDAHLANFGAYASPERQLVFDVNDFDETLPGPWEWDVKRLAASFHIAARHNELDEKAARSVVRAAVRAYQAGMRKFAGMRLTDLWYSYVAAKDVVETEKDRKRRRVAGRALEKARGKDSIQALRKLAEVVDGEYRIRRDPPLLIPVRDLADDAERKKLVDAVHETFEAYKASLPDHMKALLARYRLVDCALKVVGVGSVGTRCSVVLLEGRNRDDPLFLQCKEASQSVLEEHLAASQYDNAGQRVVEGQRLMQAVNDIFLGWVAGSYSGSHYYWRQLKDWKYSVDVENANREELDAYANLRGRTLARAHARAGDPSAIAGYLGKNDAFARAVAEFARRYADRNQADYDAFRAEIDGGRLDASELPVE